jgi:hypothetical protein
MSDLNDIHRAIGSLEAQVATLTGAVDRLTETVQGLQQSKWTTKGLIAGVALAGGAVGGKIADLFNSGQG